MDTALTDAKNLAPADQEDGRGDQPGPWPPHWAAVAAAREGWRPKGQTATLSKRGSSQIERLSLASHFTLLALDQSGGREEQVPNEQGAPVPFPRDPLPPRCLQSE